MGDWSTSTALSRYSKPSNALCLPGVAFDPYNRAANVLYIVSYASVDLPDPETPVMHTNRRRGISTSIFFKLFSEAPRIFNMSFPSVRRVLGIAMDFSPRKYAAVSDFLSSKICGVAPFAITSPHARPRPGRFRPCDPHGESYLHRVRPRARYCPNRATAKAFQSIDNY